QFTLYHIIIDHHIASRSSPTRRSSDLPPYDRRRQCNGVYAHRRARGVGRPPELPSGDRCLPRPAGERIARRSVLRRQPRFSREDACRARTLRCDLAVLEREPVPLPLNWVQGISLPLSTKL